jgi:uncharacterized membrane protein YjjP (DUF1212 family)
MNSKKFPWDKLLFVFVVGLVLGFIYPLLESRTLPWFILVIAIPFSAIIYVIAESSFTSLMNDLKHFMAGFIADIVSLLILGCGFCLGTISLDSLTVMLKSFTT